MIYFCFVDKSNSDSDQLLDITDLLKKPEKKKKQSQRQLNGSKPSNEVSAEEKDDDSVSIVLKISIALRFRCSLMRTVFIILIYIALADFVRLIHWDSSNF